MNVWKEKELFRLLDYSKTYQTFVSIGAERHCNDLWFNLSDIQYCVETTSKPIEHIDIENKKIATDKPKF